MKTLAGYLLLFLALSSNAMSNVDGANMKWKLDAFDEANDYWKDLESKTMELCIANDPSLIPYYNTIYMPYMEACRRVVRAVFLGKLTQGAGLPDMKGDPTIWSFIAPSEDEMRTYIAKDIMPRTVMEYHARVAAYKEAGGEMRKINDICETHRVYVDRLNKTFADKMSALKMRVNAKLLAERTARGDMP